MKSTVLRIGYRSGLLATIATIAFVIAQVLQLLRLLPYPWDEILIYGFSLCIVIPFLFEMLALHYYVPEEKKIWTHAALLFTVIYAVFVISNYIVQLATVIPATLGGRKDEISLLIQSPHSLFWDYDAIGYICMGIAMICAIPVFEREGYERKVRMAFFVHGVLITPLITFVYFYPQFSERLLLLGVPWGITAPLAMGMLAGLFRARAHRK